MNPRMAYTILSKELLDTLRDKRTLLMMLGVPLLLYPAVTLFGFQTVMSMHGRVEAGVSRVAFYAESPGVLHEVVSGLNQINVAESPSPMEDLQSGKLDAVVVLWDDVDGALAAGRPFDVVIRFDGTEIASREAATRIRNGLERFFDERRREQLTALGLKEQDITPFRVSQQDAASTTKTTGTLIGSLLPFFMVLMLAVGAFYPAVDLTAGEKERGTFETLLAAPVSKLEIVSGKFAAVFVLAMLTGLLNLMSMGLTFAFIFMQIPLDLQLRMGMEFALPVTAFLTIVIVMVPLAFFISAAMMALAVLARSFKEAQNLMMPLFLLVMLPGIVVILPGTRLEGAMQFLPIGNVALLFKGLIMGEATFEQAFMVFVSTGVLAVLAILAAVWMFQREEIVLSEERGLPLTLRRSQFIPRKVLPSGTALGFFAIVMLLIFYIGALAQQWDIMGGLLFTEWGLLLAPTLLLLWYARIEPRTALYLRLPSRIQTPGIALVALGWPIMAIQASFYLNLLFPVPQDFLELFTQVITEAAERAGAPLTLFALAVSPAICEEVLFRGALLSAFRQRMGTVACVVVVALLFGIFHMSPYRFLPTAFSGALLTWLVLRTDSLLAAIVTHGVMNASLVALQIFTLPPWLSRIFQVERIATHGLSPGLLLAGLATVVAGIVLIEWGRKKPPAPAPDSTDA
jgi:sodium transport system permease protein